MNSAQKVLKGEIVETRAVNCLNFFKKVNHLEGDAIELGVAFGATTFLLSALMNSLTPDKILYACDTFKGLPYDDCYDFSQACKKGECDYPNEFSQEAKNIKNIVSIIGLVEETLEQKLSDKKFCFAWLDMDLYYPTSVAYKFLEDRIVAGGIIGFHDYGFIRCPGIKKVVDEEVNKTKYKIISSANSSLFMQKIV